jgi:hypothetical protein
VNRLLGFNFGMDLASTHGKKNFRIFRTTDQADDALDSFQWEPPKDSDELFMALKAAFPRGKTHRVRMREALIEFLVQECELERDDRQAIMPREHPSHNTLLNGGSAQRNGTTGPLSVASHKSQTLSNGSSSVAKVPYRKRLPKDWDGMTVVWTRKDGVIRKPGPKRMMTEQERADYQSRRAQGACAVCRKKKRKVGIV